MEEYKKYQHVERFGSDETDGIECGTCYVFPKIDGSNAHIWHDGDRIFCGSRNRELSTDNDNSGFMNWVLGEENLKGFAMWFKDHHVYGEWLVPHSLKTYKDDAWRKFYVFDVVSPDGRHLPYDEWQSVAERQEIDYIAPIRIITNPTYDNLVACLSQNSFLIRDGAGIGEGIVIKNYEFTNKYGRQTWAKIVTTAFKEKHHKEMGAPLTKGSDMVEEKIVEEFLSDEIIDKVYANIKATDGWNGRQIPRLLQTVFYDFVRECTWDYVKKFKNPKIDFKTLNRFVQIRTKSHLAELF